jgi:ABC-2 type transport system ATP-binding protein
MIYVKELRKQYDGFLAVKGISFEVRPGEVFGLLGPNGAGKTTTVEILEGLRQRSGGEVRVLGFDPAADGLQLKDRIGVCLQQAALPDRLRVREAIALFASFYSRTVPGEALLRRLQLWEKRDTFFMHLSGGQKQRLALALALINDPQLLFLDEPSTGLDAQARLEIRSLIGELRAEKRTLLLTTHYIEEAERLCDRVAIIDEGRIIAMGAPREIQEHTLGASTIELQTGQVLPPGELPAWPGLLRQSRDGSGRGLTIVTTRPAATVMDAVPWLIAHRIELQDIRIRRPSLEDAFIELTGKNLRD